jgi:hypothetical protein
MKIDCYISENCSSEEDLRKNILEAVRLEAVDATIKFHRINEEEAQKMGLMGSPSVLINRKDILPGEIPGFS